MAVLMVKAIQWRRSPKFYLNQLRRLDPLKIDAPDPTQRAERCKDAAKRLFLMRASNAPINEAAIRSYSAGIASGLYGLPLPALHSVQGIRLSLNWPEGILKDVLAVGYEHGERIRFSSAEEISHA
jgi:hypothetical protein